VPVLGQLPGQEELNLTFEDLPPSTQQAVAEMLGDFTERPVEWSEQDVVYLHWRLLLELPRLADPETPLEEKLDTLAWALAESEHDAEPFSFAQCLRVVGTSPLSPAPYVGLVDVDDMRAWLRWHSRRWIAATLERYPQWVRDLVRAQPDVVCSELQRNPQWINEQIRAREQGLQRDLFDAQSRGEEQ
jgi:hypothetical protein